MDRLKRRRKGKTHKQNGGYQRGRGRGEDEEGGGVKHRLWEETRLPMVSTQGGMQVMCYKAVHLKLT